MYEESFNLWLIRISKSNAPKILSNHYFQYGTRNVTSKWDKDYVKLKDEPFFATLKPRMQNRVADKLFENIYEKFESFFENTETGFRRAIAH